MNIGDVVAIVSILIVIGGAVAYIIKSKKSGKKCIGCPYASSCSKNNNTCSCCSGAIREEK